MLYHGKPQNQSLLQPHGGITSRFRGTAGGGPPQLFSRKYSVLLLVCSFISACRIVIAIKGFGSFRDLRPILGNDHKISELLFWTIARQLSRVLLRRISSPVGFAVHVVVLKDLPANRFILTAELCLANGDDFAIIAVDCHRLPLLIDSRRQSNLKTELRSNSLKFSWSQTQETKNSLQCSLKTK